MISDGRNAGGCMRGKQNGPCHESESDGIGEPEFRTSINKVCKIFVSLGVLVHYRHLQPAVLFFSKGHLWYNVFTTAGCSLVRG